MGQIWSIFSIYSFNWTPPNSPLNPTFYQNVMFFHQNIDGNMKFRYRFIMIDHQIDEKTSNFDQKIGLQNSPRPPPPPIWSIFDVFHQFDLDINYDITEPKLHFDKNWGLKVNLAESL